MKSLSPAENTHGDKHVAAVVDSEGAGQEHQTQRRPAAPSQLHPLSLGYRGEPRGVAGRRAWPAGEAQGPLRGGLGSSALASRCSTLPAASGPRGRASVLIPQLSR